MGVQEKGTPQDARVLVRGEIDQPAQSVDRGFPQVLCSTPVSIDAGSSGRLELAKWIGSRDKPVDGRVMVNRIWQQLMGQGIVSSTENFGVTGQSQVIRNCLTTWPFASWESDWSVKTMVSRDCVVARLPNQFNLQRTQPPVRSGQQAALAIQSPSA